MELADTSAWTSRRKDPRVAREFEDAVRRGDVATCDMVKAELLVRRRTSEELIAARDRLEQLKQVPIGERVWRRALDVMESLAERGPLHHRQVPIQDLLIAAAAELAELPVLHYDQRFELIAEVTGQEVRAIAPLGSL